MHTWFHAQLAKKIFDGFYYLHISFIFHPIAPIFSAFSNLAGLDAEGHFAAQLGIQAGKLLHVYSF